MSWFETRAIFVAPFAEGLPLLGLLERCALLTVRE